QRRITSRPRSQPGRTEHLVIDSACVDIPVPRALLDEDGLLPPGAERDAIEQGVAALAAAGQASTS
ncbi:hypothetical protein, partial [Aeromicrobium sp.]|uniref:hypothetical protein n=1 Tax=Aeromicrobium sp. TaxID=1871063 RepID=UPI0030C1939C